MRRVHHLLEPGSDAIGFSPIFDTVAARLGLVTAAVFGAAWRHCQMRDHVCRASAHRLARLLGMNHSTVHRHLRRLVEAGYLEDMTPNRRFRPHVYRLAYPPLPPPAPDLDPAATDK